MPENTDERQPDETAAEPQEPSGDDVAQIIDSGSFARCATCQHACEIDLERGALLCKHHDMHVDAEADEIPDDCPEYERDPDKEPPPDPTEAPPG